MKVIEGEKRKHPLQGEGIYAVCPVCDGGDLVYNEKRCEIACLSCRTTWTIKDIPIEPIEPNLRLLGIMIEGYKEIVGNEEKGLNWEKIYIDNLLEGIKKDVDMIKINWRGFSLEPLIM